MARLARVVVPGVAHHVTQRGNRRQTVFFSDDDYRAYLRLLSEGCKSAGVEVWGLCLMPNHVHLILTPSDEGGLRNALAEAHRRYSWRVNQRENWRGFLWQGRFSSAPMDQKHLLACARYVELNPVRAKLVERPEQWQWSSIHAHLAGKDDGLVTSGPLLGLAEDWAGFLGAGLAVEDHRAIQGAERTGRPLGSKEFVAELEGKLGRTLQKEKPGPKQLWGHNT